MWSSGSGTTSTSWALWTAGSGHPKPEHAAGPTIYWHVDDVQAAFDRLLELGATEHLKPIERGPGFVPASVVDPFGNILGVMYNQHYLDILEGRSQV